MLVDAALYMINNETLNKYGNGANKAVRNHSLEVNYFVGNVEKVFLNDPYEFDSLKIYVLTSTYHNLLRNMN